MTDVTLTLSGTEARALESVLALPVDKLPPV